MVGMGEFPYGVMNVRPGGVSSCLCGKVVRLNIARDACMGADFSEVSGGPMADPEAEEFLQGLEEGKMLRFQDGLGFVDQPVDKVKAAEAISVNGHGAVWWMVEEGLSDGH